jgi:adenylate cyclase
MKRSDEPAKRAITAINLEPQVPAIREHGGEILKFMGDGLLAVFPIAKDGGNLAEVCGRALEASRKASANVNAMHYPSGDELERFRFVWRCILVTFCSAISAA